jgi:DNA invertase Pin-like site-specific DNA recombinase
LAGTDRDWFLQILAVIAEFEANLIKQRTREGMAVTRSRGKLRGKPPKLSHAQAAEVYRMHASCDYAIAQIAELFYVSGPTGYRCRAWCGTARRHPTLPDMRRYDELLPAGRATGN